MRVSEYFKLGRTQPYLDFVDVRLDTDIEVFVDPTALKHMKSPWGHECASLLQSFFEVVLKSIKGGDDAKAQKLLGSLNERNEFHHLKRIRNRVQKTHVPQLATDRFCHSESNEGKHRFGLFCKFGSDHGCRYAQLIRECQ